MLIDLLPEKPPIVLATRIERFVCLICKKPGKGPPNSLVHSGRCRDEHSRAIARRSAGRRKQRRLNAQPL